MSPEAQALFYFIAFVLFVVGGILDLVRYKAGGQLWEIAFGLASWVLVALWSAVKAV